MPCQLQNLSLHFYTVNNDYVGVCLQDANNRILDISDDVCLLFNQRDR